jgi:hypothetical protein
LFLIAQLAALQALHQPYRCNEPGVLRGSLHAK